MNNWEIEVCKRNPEINQRRLELVSHLDRVLWEMKTLRKYFDKEEMNNEEKNFMKIKLIEWGIVTLK